MTGPCPTRQVRVTGHGASVASIDRVSVTQFRVAHRRLAGVLAVAVPAVMWAEFLGMGLSRPGYDMLTDQASQLGAWGTPNAGLFTVGFFYAGGLLTALLGIGLQLCGIRGWLWRGGAAMITVAGLLLVLGGYFPTAGESPQATQAHIWLTQTCFVLASVAPFLLLAGARQRLPLWVRRIWLSSSIGALVIECIAVMLRSQIHFPEGLFQRPFLAALTIWFVATGTWLLRHGPELIPQPAD